MNKEKIIASGLLQQYALGLTDSEEEQEVEFILETHPELMEEVRNLQIGIREYALQQGIPPHPSRLQANSSNAAPLKEKESGKTGATPSFPRPNPAILAALLGIFILWYFQTNRSKSTIQLLRNELQLCQQEQNQLRQTQLLYAQLTDSNAKAITLQGTGVSPEALSVAFWNEASGKGFINPAGLPTPPENCQFQIWADVNGEMINLGLIDPSASSIQPIAYVEGASSLNITIEPLGGSKHPTVSKLIANGNI